MSDDAFIALAMTQWTMDTDVHHHTPPLPTPHTLLRATRPISFLRMDLFDTVPPKLQQRFGSDLRSRRSFVSFSHVRDYQHRYSSEPALP